MDTFGEYLGKIMEPKYSEEFMFKFAKWCGKHHTRLVRGWVKNNASYNRPEEIFTTKELLEEFKRSKDAVSE